MAREVPKILVVGPLPPPYAGPEVSLKLFTESPISNYFQVSIYNTSVNMINEKKGEVGFGLISKFFRFINGLVCHIRKEKPDLVYYYVTATSMGWLFKDVWCIFLSRLWGKKVVIHMRAGHFRVNYDRVNFFSKNLIQHALNRTHLNLAQSPFLADQYRGIVKKEGRINYCYNMIDTEQFQNPDLNDYDENTVLFLGHLSFAKGYSDLLRILPIVGKEFPKVRFCFAGTKLQEERNVLHDPITGFPLPIDDPEIVFQEYVAGKWEANYQYLGIVKGEEKMKWLRKCNVFVLPSYSEGFSMAILEAMSMGKPVVCTAVGAMRDFFEDGKNGYKIKPGELEALANSILNLLRDRQGRDNMGAYNHQFTRTHFSPSILAERYRKLFNHVLEN